MALENILTYLGSWVKSLKARALAYKKSRLHYTS